MNVATFHAVAQYPSSQIWLFDYRLQEHKSKFPNLISRRQFNDRRKKTAGLCEEIRKRIAMKMDGEEEQFFVDSKPIGGVSGGKRETVQDGTYWGLFTSSGLRLLRFTKHIPVGGIKSNQ